MTACAWIAIGAGIGAALKGSWWLYTNRPAIWGKAGQ